MNEDRIFLVMAGGFLASSWGLLLVHHWLQRRKQEKLDRRMDGKLSGYLRRRNP
jgi:cytosine/uracil/thiamine/allantoin permease